MAGPLVLMLVAVSPWLAAILWIGWRRGWRSLVPRDLLPRSFAERTVRRPR